MAIPSPMSSRSSSPASSSDEEEMLEAKRREAQFLATAAQTAKKGPEDSIAAFAPPKGMKKASGEETLTEFSLEAIKDKLDAGCQLWAVRLPQNFGKLRYLNDIKLSLPDHADASTSAPSAKVALFEHKKKDYEVYTLGDNTEDVSNIGAGEMRNMTALLANKRKKYTSVPIQKHLIIKQSISFPPETSGQSDSAAGYVRHEQPDGLDGFFKPAGFDSSLEQARTKRQRTENDDQLPPPLQSFTSPKGNETVGDVSMAAPSSPSKEEKKRLKQEKKEKKEAKKEKKKRKSEAAAAVEEAE